MFALLLLCTRTERFSKVTKWHEIKTKTESRHRSLPSRALQRRFLLKASANGKIFYANQAAVPNCEWLFSLPIHTTARKVPCASKKGLSMFFRRELCQCQLYNLVSILFSPSLPSRVAKTSTLVIATREIKQTLLKIWKSCPRKSGETCSWHYEAARPMIGFGVTRGQL